MNPITGFQLETAVAKVCAEIGDCTTMLNTSVMGIEVRIQPGWDRMSLIAKAFDQRVQWAYWRPLTMEHRVYFVDRRQQALLPVWHIRSACSGFNHGIDKVNADAPTCSRCIARRAAIEAKRKSAEAFEAAIKDLS